jgi:hypothetical protein
MFKVQQILFCNLLERVHDILCHFLTLCSINQNNRNPWFHNWSTLKKI